MPGDRQLVFPAAEANHPDFESDTWFLAGELTGESDRKFAFLTIFNKNRPGQAIVADFYTLALFDLDNGTYGTYTDYDMPGTNKKDASRPKLSFSDHHLDISYDSRAGTAVWRTCRDEQDQLLPYTYDVSFCGTDQHGDAMQVDLHVTPSRAPVPLGAAAYNGRIECFGQPNTYSYFQTGMTMTGSLSWGSTRETMTGSAGHVDRQWFPMVANDGGPTGDIRSRAHEWRTINLDNGVDLSVWRQFDRTNRNALQPFSGATTSSPDAEPEYADDIEVTVASYVRWPESIRTLVPASGRGTVHARSSPPDITQARPGPDRGAVGGRPRARTAARIHGGAVPIPRNAARRGGQRLRVLRTVAGAVPGLGVGRRARSSRAGRSR